MRYLIIREVRRDKARSLDNIHGMQMRRGMKADVMATRSDAGGRLYIYIYIPRKNRNSVVLVTQPRE